MSRSLSPQKKKVPYKISNELYSYLVDVGRTQSISVQYDDLLRFNNSMSLFDKKGVDTLWLTVSYSPSEMEELNRELTGIYATLKTNGDIKVMEHLHVERIDFCTFGNSKPFRIKIVNNYNDNYDYYYIKYADASRIYGLEWEHILSPNRINYFVNHQTLVEEHIVGIPGDQFMKYNLQDSELNEIRLAKEFVKFNERCFVRLLGDMRSYNYVIDVTPDFEDTQYRIRAIDFDQQCYEGRKNLYIPQFFKENLPFVELCMKHLNANTVKQYQSEERALIAKRIRTSKYRVNQLLNVMKIDQLSTQEKVDSLKQELAQHYQNDLFLQCENMGEIMNLSLNLLVKGILN
jgi:NAD-specific glutamate dehydrogenase